MEDIRNRIYSALERNFAPDNRRAPDYFAELLSTYLASGLADPGMTRQLETGGDHAVWSCVWEAMLYRHLCACGYTPRNRSTKAGQSGPDFAVDVGGKTIWLEAVVPEPVGIPADWLAPPEWGFAKMRPDTERVLRCAEAVDKKQKKFAAYLEKGIVAPGDCTIIAVNICMLSHFDMDGDGISGAPLCAEAVYPIGPRGVNISRDDEILGPMQNVERYEIPKAGGKPVSTWAFLNERFANVSAVLQAHSRTIPDDGLPVALMHNPTAKNPLQRSLFNPYFEFVGTPVGDDRYQMHDIAAKRT